MIYQYLGISDFKHDFDNVEQSTQEDDSLYGIYGDHVIRKEFGEEFKDHYIQITPPFVFEIKDRTNWEPILTAIATLPPASGGGRRQRRRPAKKSRRRNKKRTYQSRSIRDGSN
jgi:hypothetical protein